MVLQEWIHIAEFELAILYMKPRLMLMARRTLGGTKFLPG